MVDTIRIKRRSAGAPGAPASLASAELAYNEVDHTLYYGEGNTGGLAVTIVPVGGIGVGSNANPQMNGTAAPGIATLWSRGDHVHPSDTTRAPLASPSFTGIPLAPTAAVGTNTTQIATTAFVDAQILATHIDQLLPPQIDVNWANHKIVNVVDPSNPQDAATKNYVDAVIQGLQVKPTATVATTAALPANAYNNGTSGVGATLTATSNGALTIDSHSVVAGDIVLVKNEASAAYNGLYTVTQPGSTSAPYVLTRHTDMNTPGEMSGAFIPVGNTGVLNANSLWLSNPTTPVVVGTTPIPFTQLNAPFTLVAGNGLNLAGNVISAVGTANRIVSGPSGIDIASTYVGQTSITTLGIITAGTWNGNPVAVAYGGSGATTLTGYLMGNGTAPFTASPTIPNTAITGLGTMSVQNSNAVTITGGTIDNIIIDGGTF